MLENNFSRSMNLYDGIGFIFERPMTLGLLVVAVLLIVLPSYRARRARLRAMGVADGD
jgi:putative tricarboxylic transport membrane protein